jgi:hypothetical protein
MPVIKIKMIKRQIEINTSNRHFQKMLEIAVKLGIRTKQICEKDSFLNNIELMSSLIEIFHVMFTFLKPTHFVQALYIKKVFQFYI